MNPKKMKEKSLIQALAFLGEKVEVLSELEKESVKLLRIIINQLKKK